MPVRLNTPALVTVTEPLGPVIVPPPDIPVPALTVTLVNTRLLVSQTAPLNPPVVAVIPAPNAPDVATFNKPPARMFSLTPKPPVITKDPEPVVVLPMLAVIVDCALAASVVNWPLALVVAPIRILSTLPVVPALIVIVPAPVVV